MVNIMEKSVNLVLGGGGARGIASVGVLIELLNRKNEIICITGTSAGALVGGLYSTYKESSINNNSIVKYLYNLIEEDFTQFKDINWFNLISFYGHKLFGNINFGSFGIYKGVALHK